jgi:hypothetical protein
MLHRLPSLQAPQKATFGPAASDVPPPTNRSRHALQDYQMQLMLLEQQNKKRLIMARSELDAAAAAEGQDDAASSQAGKAGKADKGNVPNAAGRSDPGTEQSVNGPGSTQPINRLAGAGIVPAVVRDV